MASSISASPGLELPLLEQSAALHVDRDRRELGVAELLADGDRTTGGRNGALVLACAQHLHGDRHQDITVFHARASLALEQAPGPSDPAVGLAVLAANRELEPEPARGAQGALHRSSVEVRQMRALERPQILVVQAQEIGRRRQELEILALEPRRPIGAREPAIGLDPRALRTAPSSPVELCDRRLDGVTVFHWLQLAHPGDRGARFRECTADDGARTSLPSHGADPNRPLCGVR